MIDGLIGKGREAQKRHLGNERPDGCSGDGRRGSRAAHPRFTASKQAVLGKTEEERHSWETVDGTNDRPARLITSTCPLPRHYCIYEMGNNIKKLSSGAMSIDLMNFLVKNV
jgi:hypothetical protein